MVTNIGFGVKGATHCVAELPQHDMYIYRLDLQKIQVKEDMEARKLFELSLRENFTAKKTRSDNKYRFFFKKEKQGDRRIITLLGFIKIKYTKKNKRNRTDKSIMSGGGGFMGDYDTWQEVKSLVGGYDASNILQKTLESTLKVKNKEAVFERDSYIFDRIQYSYPLLAALFKIAVENNNTLDIVDFGGAFGSHYFQNKDFLKPIYIKSWNVVEQGSYIEIGNEKIADNILHFYYSIDEIFNADVLILSSVIQYLEKPYEWLDKFISKNYKYILIDRTAFSTEQRNRLTLQIVPKEIYEASYPAWFLNEFEFLSKFKEKYDTILDFENNIDIVNEIPSIYKGYLFKRKVK